MPPFRYENDRNPYVGSIEDLLLRRGDIEAQRATAVGNAQARAAEQSGQAWAGATSGMANAVGGVLQQAAQEKRDAPIRAMQTERAQLDLNAARSDAAARQAYGAQDQAFQHLLQSGQPPSPQAILQIYGPERGAKIASGLAAFSELQTNQVKDARENAGRLAVGVKALSPDMQAQFWPAIREAAVKGGLADAEHIPEQPVPEYLDAVIGWATGKGPEAPKTREIRTRNADGSESVQVVEDKPGFTATSAPPPEKKYEVSVPGPNGPIRRLVSESQMTQGVPEYRAPAAAAGGTGPSDIKESIAGMKDGTLPPQLPGRASKDYTAIMAEAHRQGYDLAGAVTDWNATQKHIATLNGAQQLRLNQSINALPEMLDSVDALASQWKAGRFADLNKINLMAAKKGVYGKQAATIANQLDSQIADVTADLGNVYMGGNSPTDHALELAGKSLKAEWDETVLHDMVALAKKNVTIRQNSIRNTGVAGASADNAYAPQQPAAGGGVQRKPIPGIPGAEAESTDGGRTWKRTK